MSVINPVSMGEQLRMVRGVESIIPKGGATATPEVGGAPKTSFADYLSQQFETVNTQGIEAEKAIQRSIMGQDENPHQTMIAVQKAEISLTLLMSVKERIERAYQEIIRMPI